MKYLRVVSLVALMSAAAGFGQWRRVEPQQSPQKQQPQPPSGQQDEGQETVIKLDVELVNITCAVRDKNGRLIPNLTQNDFIVREDGKPQTIKYFARETDLPLTLGLLVDVSPSQERLIEVEKDAAAQFFGQVLRPKDMAFLISFGSDAELLQDYTSSAKLLRAGLEGLKVNASTSGVHPGPVPTIYTPRGTVLYDAVYLATKEKLTGQVGRKAIVLITDGIDQGSRVKLAEAMREAHRADTIIYGIEYFDPGAYSRGGWTFGGSSGDLKKMAEETGGRVFRVGRKNTLPEIFKEIQEELRSQYALGYTPANPVRDGSFRKIEVKTKDDDLKVQARKGYFAGEGN